ncbi:hypothetical protein LCGC14_1066300 [marine sediment metagenome]|uniref:Major capsid protein n=1 Tax=marine sediment metagenome TaxID=412755 RepID=A0A0F9Q2L1_9ZZZZ
MSIQVASTVDLITAQRVIIANTLFTEEYSRPTSNIVSQFTLGQGEKSLVIPKVGQMSAAKLTDGVDMTDSQDIGMSTNTVSPVEAGLKVIVTDKLVRQLNESVFTIIGQQMGQAMGRIVERDCVALFSSLNAGSTLGVDNKDLTLKNLAACIAHAKANKFGENLVVIHHPNAIFQLAFDFLGTARRLDAPAWVTKLTESFYTGITLNRVPLFETGEIDYNGTAGQVSGYGAIFDRSALGILTSQGLTSGTEHDNSMRATEIVTVKDYIAFEVDDTKGAPMLYEMDDQVTTA